MEQKHPLQRHIMKTLTFKQKVRYRDLKPKGVEGNRFMYHLGVLINEKYVSKGGIFYSLTQKGERYADRMTLETFLPRIQPKIMTMIYCLNKNGELLLFERTRRPASNLLNLPHGKIHMGEKIKESAEREMREKTGLKVTLSHIGDIYIRIYHDGELVAHILHHLFSAKFPKGELIKGLLAGKPSWSKIEKIPQNRYARGFREIIKIISQNKKGFFFKEFDLHLSKDD